jgi:nitrite reductase/ring-hydroxylating ferredoxin subunit
MTKRDRRSEFDVRHSTFDIRHFMEASTPLPNQPPRRSFLIRSLAALIGGLLVVFPFLAGVGVVLDPLRRRNKQVDGEGRLIRIAPLDAVPSDGLPHQFPVLADVADAWTKAPSQRIGSVFLRRTDDGVTAFSAECPHLGCSVDFVPQSDRYQCPCHVSGFALNGNREFGPSLRGLDQLEVKMIGPDGQQEVWIVFERFRTGIPQKIPV